MSNVFKVHEIKTHPGENMNGFSPLVLLRQMVVVQFSLLWLKLAIQHHCWILYWPKKEKTKYRNGPTDFFSNLPLRARLQKHDLYWNIETYVKYSNVEFQLKLQFWIFFGGNMIKPALHHFTTHICVCNFYVKGSSLFRNV